MGSPGDQDGRAMGVELWAVGKGRSDSPGIYRGEEGGDNLHRAKHVLDSAHRSSVSQHEDRSGQGQR